MKLLALFFLFINLIIKILAVNEPKDGKIRTTFDEIFGEGWDEDDPKVIKVEETPLNSNLWAWNFTKKKRTERTEIQTVQTLTEQAEDDENIDQNVEAYNSDSTDQNLTQEYPGDDNIDQNVEAYNSDSTDQNLTQEYPGDDNIDQNLTQEDFKKIEKFSEQERGKIIYKFHAMRNEYKQHGKVTQNERNKIEQKISRKLGVTLRNIYKWKKEFGLIRKIKKNKKPFYEKKKREFIDRMDEIKMSKYGEQTKLAQDLGISKDKIYYWKKEFGLHVNSYSAKEKTEMMGKYYKIKQRNPKISNIGIANILNIGIATLHRWKKQFVNSVDEHSMPENDGAVQDRNSSEHPMPSSDDNLWAWNFAKKQRTERTVME